MIEPLPTTCNQPTIRIDPEFRDWVMPLSQEEFSQLEANLLTEGCRDALIVWISDPVLQPTLLDGHHRYAICKAHNLSYRIDYKIFPDREAAKNWIILNQIGRRNITPQQRAYLIGKIYRETKKEQGEHTGNQYTMERANNLPLPKTAERIAEQFNVSHQTVKNAEKFADAVDTIADTYGGEAKQKILSGATKLPQKAITETAKQLYTSETPEWYTPEIIIESVLELFGTIDLDPCSNGKGADANVPAKEHYTHEDDGLSRAWHGKVYMNPPYGREVAQWVEKVTAEYQAGNISEAIVLIAARTDTRWFNLLVNNGGTWCAVEGRLIFSTPGMKTSNSAPFPSAIFYLGDNQQDFYHCFKHHGPIYRAIEEEEMMQYE
jgi:phage N-6-adenine-methyltransferase